MKAIFFALFLYLHSGFWVTFNIFELISSASVCYPVLLTKEGSIW